MSANDHELIRLAAKAAGIEGSFDDTEDVGDGLWINGERTPDNDRYWNPLTKDGDALRLVNKLRMRVEHHVRHPFVAVFAHFGFYAERVEEAVDADVDAATRRAIVRAAAEIGRQA